MPDWKYEDGTRLILFLWRKICLRALKKKKKRFPRREGMPLCTQVLAVDLHCSVSTCKDINNPLTSMHVVDHNKYTYENDGRQRPRSENIQVSSFFVPFPSQNILVSSFYNSLD